MSNNFNSGGTSAASLVGRSIKTRVPNILVGSDFSQQE